MENHLTMDEIFKNIVKEVTHKMFNNIDTAAQANGEPLKCEDQFVAIIEITKEKVVFIENDFLQRAKVQEYQNEKCLDTIALVLESPHKEELKNAYNVAPARGTTGKNIESMLLGNLAKYMYINDTQQNGAYFLSDEKIKCGKYKLLLINAVQYQCSLGDLEESKANGWRDEIFQKMFSNQYVKNDFKERLKKYNPKIIINCCTGGEYSKADGLQKLVQDEIDADFTNAIKLIGSHPASAFFSRGFCDA